jgi:hypothetical protein
MYYNQMIGVYVKEVRLRTSSEGIPTLRRSLCCDGVIFDVMAGLGNQLFQYAAARATSLRLGCPLYLNIDWFDRYTDRELALNAFKIVGTLFRGTKWEKFRDRNYPRLAPRVEYLGNDIDQRIFAAQPGMRFMGNWQSEVYFRAFTQQIREEVSLSVPLSENSRRVIDQIRSRSAVAVHVRRGDYISDPATRKIYATCAPDYYQRASAKLREMVSTDVTFFLFSDDIDWATQNLKFLGNCIPVDCNGQNRPWEDLALMAACNHNIIPNSTFSWWAAWLNPNPNKIVISPAVWYIQPNMSNRNIVPDDFITV